MRYQLNYSLQQTKELSTAISFWESKKIKDKVAEFIETWEEIGSWKLQIKWREFTKTVVDEWVKDMLPKTLNDDMIHIVRMIGETIFNWYQHINYDDEMEEKAINWIENIKWTPYGTVDAVKVFESSWLDNPNVGITAVYNFACYYAIEDHIDNLWDKIPHNMQNVCYEDIYDELDQHILAYWKHRRESDLPNLMRSFQDAARHFNEKDMKVFNRIYDESRSTEENMLRLSVSTGFLNATKFFWEQLTEVERDKSVVKCARITVLSFSYAYAMPTRCYQQSQYSEIWIFLMNQMSESHKKAFFNEVIDTTDKVLEMLLCTWPWQKLLIPALKDMIQYQDGNSGIPCKVLCAITFQMMRDHELGYSLKTNKYRRLFREVWLIIPASIKQKTVNHWGRAVIDDLIKVLDLESLDLLFNDPEITDVRDKLIDSLLSSLTNLIRQHNFNKLNEILNVICRSAEETELFKQKIVHCYVCDHLANDDDYELADRLLDWIFDTDEKKKGCKNHYKSMVIREIWSVFHKDIYSAKDECSRFLHWCLKSDEEITLFKKEIIAKLESGESSTNDLIQLKRQGILDDFVSWCLSIDEQFDQMRRITQSVSERN